MATSETIQLVQSHKKTLEPKTWENAVKNARVVLAPTTIQALAKNGSSSNSSTSNKSTRRSWAAKMGSLTHSHPGTGLCCAATLEKLSHYYNKTKIKE